MGIKTFNLPDPGEGLTEAEIVSWRVAPGDTVTVNQIVVEVETSKSLVELPIPWAGTVVDILEAGRIPVVSTIAPDLENPGQVLNVNADTAAAALAVALRARKLVVLTDVPGIYADWPDPDSLLSELGVEDAEELLTRVDSGMVPKLEACIRAVRGGVPQAHVIDGRTPHSLLLEVFTEEGIGTMILPAADDDVDDTGAPVHLEGLS